MGFEEGEEGAQEEGRGVDAEEEYFGRGEEGGRPDHLGSAARI